MPTVGATGGSTFRTSGGSYIFNWDTTTGGVGGPGCYTVFVQANDGSSERTTSIRFK
jgi:hypothetical protein